MNETDKNLPKEPGARSRLGGSRPAPANNPGESSLGAFLTATRENRGVTRDAAIKETRIPAHYIAMIESDNYAAISDQLYVLPFIRRYAEFLGLDSEEVAIRFVREVQRAESNVIKISEPIVDRRRGQSQPWIWIGAMMVIVIVAAIIFLRDHRRSMLSPSESVPNEPAQGSAASEKSAAPAAAQPPGPAIPAQAKPQSATQRSMPPKPAGVEQSVPNTE